MSSALTSLIPVLEGSANYQSWSANMKNFLVSQGQWTCMAKTWPSLVDKDGQDLKGEALEKAQEKREPLEEANGKALGNISLRLHHSIQYLYRSEVYAAALWSKLEEAYGKPGLTGVYLEFKGILSGQTSAHYYRLSPDDATPEQSLLVLGKGWLY